MRKLTSLLSTNLQKKLEELNKNLVSIEQEKFDQSLAKKYGPVPLNVVAPGDVIENEWGDFLLWERPLHELISYSEELYSTCSLIFERGGFAGGVEPFHPDIQSFLEFDSSRILYLDIETAGLGSGTVFLVGIMSFESGSFTLRQLLARDYSEEAPMLSYLAELYKKYDAFVTFNGKSFDVRYPKERFTANRISCNSAFFHLDLLHESRRHWKDKLPNCKLQTLERHITGRIRYGDIPGAEIPDAYHDFVKTGDASSMKDILHHNALDLITLAEVLFHILLRKDEPSQ